MFYEFRQNNSGGSFELDAQSGISTAVIIEADTVEQAVSRALSIGIYFDGVDKGIDCGCCGDRWYVPYGDGDVVPSLYREAIDADYEPKYGKWAPEDVNEIYVHYVDGSIKGFG